MFNFFKKRKPIETFVEPRLIVTPTSKERFKRGDRVRINSTSGFHKGALGVVEFQEPHGRTVWVTRDGSGGPCWFHNDEVDLFINLDETVSTQ